MTLLADQIELLDQAATLELRGTVVEVRGLAIRVADLPLPIGASVTISPRKHQSARTQGRTSSKTADAVQGEVVGFDCDQTIVMPYGNSAGISRGDYVIAGQNHQTVWVGSSLLGRVLNGYGNPIDGKGALADTRPYPLMSEPVDPLDRPVIDTPLGTGVRAVDSLISIGRGQRMGVFAAPGVGKSTLLGTMAKHTAADVSVIAMIGERGREVREFIENTLGEEGLKNSIVVCATSDEPALLRLRAAMVACAIAEYFRDQGADVLLMMDSVTRFCHAQREIGLATGEPPATRGYPPSVFSMLPRLLERAGRTSTGSITGLFAVLVEGDDMDEPVSDAVRGILDGHILLSRALAARGHYPAIDVLSSISRVSDDIIEADHQRARSNVLKLINAYGEVEDLLNIGAYPAGSNADFDLAIACKDTIDQFLQQGRSTKVNDKCFDHAKAMLLALHTRIEQARDEIAQHHRKAGQPRR